MSMLDWKDTIVGLATAVGDGCRSILRLSGPDAHALAATAFLNGDPPPWPRPIRKPVVIRIDAWQRTVEGVLFAWPDGRSATGQPIAELHLPAGPALTSAIQEQLVGAGARPAKRGEFTLRSFLAGKIDLAQAEGVLGLVEAADVRQLAFAVDRRTGGLSRRIAALRSTLLDFLADVEASLDFVEEDIQFVDRSGVTERLKAAIAEVESLQAEHGRRSMGAGRPTVVFVGPPNAGKSSLFNALLGDARAITSPEPGATRDVIVATAKIGGIEVELLDTAGVDPTTELKEAIYEQAASLRDRSTKAASIVVHCLPVGEPTTEEWVPAASRLLVRTHGDRDPTFSDLLADCSTSVVGPPGVEPLVRLLAERLDAQVGDAPAGVVERTADCLTRAGDRLDETQVDFTEGGGLELLAVGLRLALDDLGEIVGAVYTDDLLDRVFSRFCIGK
jgi:tRNA modification GTPase